MSIGPRHALNFGAVAAMAVGCASVSPVSTVPVTTAALLGQWELSHVGPDEVSKGMTLAFSADGSLTGSVRCNGFSTSYELLSQRIVLVKAIITVAGCGAWPPNRVIVERAEKTLFSNATVASLSGNGKLLYLRGRDTLKFRRIIRKQSVTSNRLRGKVDLFAMATARFDAAKGTRDRLE